LPPPSVGAITRGGLPFEEQAKRLRSLKPPQEAPEGDPLERDRAYALVHTAVRQWIAAALRHKRLEDRYTAQLDPVTDEATCHAAAVGARNAEGVTGLAFDHWARYCALTGRLAAEEAVKGNWSDAAHDSGDCLYWWGVVDTQLDYVNEATRMVVTLQRFGGT